MTEHSGGFVQSFKCDECDKTWDRNANPLHVLRMIVADHLWTEHAIRPYTDASEDRLPMTPEQIVWVRAQRRTGRPLIVGNHPKPVEGNTVAMDADDPRWNDPQLGRQP